MSFCDTAKKAYEDMCELSAQKRSLIDYNKERFDSLSDRELLERYRESDRLERAAIRQLARERDLTD